MTTSPSNPPPAASRSTPPSSSLSDDEKLAVAARFAAASRHNDTAAYRALCTPDAITWHNYDGVESGVEQTVAGITGLHRLVPDLVWTDVALHPTPAGFVSQTVMTGTGPGGPLNLHSCIVVTLDGSGLITRVEEYLDRSQTKPLRG